MKKLILIVALSVFAFGDINKEMCKHDLEKIDSLVQVAIQKITYGQGVESEYRKIRRYYFSAVEYCGTERLKTITQKFIKIGILEKEI